MSFWSDKHVLVTGRGGFLGFLAEKLRERRPAANVTPRHTECDLLDRAAVAGLLSNARPDVLIHAAAVVGGIGANRAHPGRLFYENALMGIQLMEEARRRGVGKMICLGTICTSKRLLKTHSVR